MSTVDEIKTAALRLPAADKLDLYRWLNNSDEVRHWQREELKREIQKGLDSLQRGGFTEHEVSSLNALGQDIKTRGRERLQAGKQ